MGRHFKEPLKEGVLLTLYKLFIIPLLRHKHRNGNIRDFLDSVFCVEERFIDRYLACSDFRLSGIFMAAPHRHIQGLGDRAITKGTQIWVRHDVTERDQYDVEVIGGINKATQVFRLTKLEWLKTKSHLQIKPFKVKMRREQLSWE